MVPFAVLELESILTPLYFATRRLMTPPSVVGSAGALEKPDLCVCGVGLTLMLAEGRVSVSVKLGTAGAGAAAAAAAALDLAAPPHPPATALPLPGGAEGAPRDGNRSSSPRSRLEALLLPFFPVLDEATAASWPVSPS